MLQIQTFVTKLRGLKITSTVVSFYDYFFAVLLIRILSLHFYVALSQAVV